MDIPIQEKLQDPGIRERAPRPAPEHVVGWGIDLDRASRPGVPMEQPGSGEPDQPRSRQPEDPRVLHSIERPGLTSVFGTTCPPRGLSGVLRRWAFGYSESDLRHWLVLLLADRIDVVEGVFSDLGRGHVPNVYREMGGPAELRHNPAGAAKKVLLVAAVGGLCCWALSRRSARRRGEV